MTADVVVGCYCSYDLCNLSIKCTQLIRLFVTIFVTLSSLLSSFIHSPNLAVVLMLLLLLLPKVVVIQDLIPPDLLRVSGMLLQRPLLLMLLL